ncbi:MORC family CW-type zinc finger protein 4 [Gracilariopsis chorda]|uniref:MORC family CW-type zinc finger protein 4 n=1 Tax=Gracilariopsis chorda TaxID=448386 RepID=A0A2V3IS07_9FLOR|nr:MORC family CW-type zinc finger protein 4 [Gracilariopsis chorda]|eukprot:PXF44517.1 MORC family CW-type zinc finger protein 4 [Gracilariopsis chorda]
MPHSPRSPQAGRVHKWALGAFATLVDHAVAHSDVHIDVARTPTASPSSSRNRIADMFDPANESPNVIVEWGHHLTDQHHRVAAFCTYSPWHTVQQISNIFASIRHTGTVLAISSLNRDMQQAQLELDIETDPFDIRLAPPACTTRNHFMSSIRLSHSLRSYLELLYINPSFRIHLRGHLIRERRLFTTMYARRDYTYNYHRSLPASSTSPHPSKTVAFRFGFDSDAHENEYGMLLYHNRRLVKPFLKLGFQMQPDNQVRVVGVIDTTHLTPTPNMQSFEQDQPYQDLIFTLNQALRKYWAPYGSMTNVYRKHCNDPLQKWLRCDACARWRQLAQDVPYPPISARVQWTCRMNNGGTNECNVPDDVDHQPVPVERLLHGAKVPTHPIHLPRKRPRSPKTPNDCERELPANHTVHVAHTNNTNIEPSDMLPSDKTVSPLPKLRTPAHFHSLTPSDGVGPGTDPFSLRGSSSPLSKSTSSPANMLEMAASAAPLSGAVYRASSKVKQTTATIMPNDRTNSYDLTRNFIHERDGPTNSTIHNDGAKRTPMQSVRSHPDPLYPPPRSTPSRVQNRNRNEPSNMNITNSLNGDRIQRVSKGTPCSGKVPSQINRGLTGPRCASIRHAYSPNADPRNIPSQSAPDCNGVVKYGVNRHTVQLFEDKRRHHSERNPHSNKHQSQTHGPPHDATRPALHTFVHHHAHNVQVAPPSQKLGSKHVHQSQDPRYVTNHERHSINSPHSGRKDKGSVKVLQSLHNAERVGGQPGRNESKDIHSKPASAGAGAVPNTQVNDVAEHSSTIRLSKEEPYEANRDMPDPLGDKNKPVTPAHNLLQTPTGTRQDDQREHCFTANLPPIPGMPSPNTANSFLDVNTENILVAPPLGGIDMSRDFLNFGDLELGLKTPSQLKLLSKKRTPSTARTVARNQSAPQRTGRFETISLHGADLPARIPPTEQHSPSDQKELPKSQSKGVQSRRTRTGNDERTCHPTISPVDRYGEKRDSTDRKTLKHTKVNKQQSEVKSNRRSSRVEPGPRQKRVEDSTHERAGPADMCTPSDLSAVIPWSQIAATAAAAGAFAAAAATAGNANGVRSQSRIEYQPPQASSAVNASKERISELREELREQKKQTELYKGKLQELICCLAPAVNGGVTKLIRNLEETNMSDLSDSIMVTVSEKTKEEASRDQLQALQASRASEEIACASLEKLRSLVRTFLDEAVGMVKVDEQDKPIEKHLEEYLHLIDVLPPS